MWIDCVLTELLCGLGAPLTSRQSPPFYKMPYAYVRQVVTKQKRSTKYRSHCVSTHDDAIVISLSRLSFTTG